MHQLNEKRTTVLSVVRVSPSEKEAIKQAYLSSSFSNQSTFIRATLLEKSRITEAEKRLQDELLSAKVFEELGKMETQILKMVQELKLKEGPKMDKKKLLLPAKLLQSIKIIKEQLNEKDQL